MVLLHRPGAAQTVIAPAEIRIVRHDRVCQKLKLSSAKLFDMVAKGQFPKGFTIVPGGRAVGWLESDVDAWILARRAEQVGS
jgi:prophage regulatory protein